MEKNKVKLTICGAEYVIASGEENKYMIELGNEVDEKITSILRQNPRISVTQAAVLAALEFADAEKKATSDAEKLRSSIQEYLEDSSRDKLNCEIATREADRIVKEFAEYKKAAPRAARARRNPGSARRRDSRRSRRRIPRRTGAQCAPQRRKFRERRAGAGGRILPCTRGQGLYHAQHPCA